MKQLFVMSHPLARRRAVAAVVEAPDGCCVTVSEPKRNSDQNALMWVLLSAFAEQLVWPVNGEMVKLEAPEWKDILTAAFRKETARVAMGLNGGMVFLGQRTSKFGKREMAEFIEFVKSVAVDRGVEITEQA